MGAPQDPGEPPVPWFRTLLACRLSPSAVGFLLVGTGGAPVLVAVQLFYFFFFNDYIIFFLLGIFTA